MRCTGLPGRPGCLPAAARSARCAQHACCGTERAQAALWDTNIEGPPRLIQPNLPTTCPQPRRVAKGVWNCGVTPGSIIRSLGPWGPGLVSKYARNRFRQASRARRVGS